MGRDPAAQIPPSGRAPYWPAGSRTTLASAVSRLAEANGRPSGGRPKQVAAARQLSFDQPCTIVHTRGMLTCARPPCGAVYRPRTSDPAPPLCPDCLARIPDVEVRAWHACGAREAVLLVAWWCRTLFDSLPQCPVCDEDPVAGIGFRLCNGCLEMQKRFAKRRSRDREQEPADE